MDDKVLRIATILGVPGFALGVLYLLLRSFGFTFAQIDPILSGAIAIVFLLVVGGITAFALHLWRPSRPTAPSEIASQSAMERPSSAANFFQLGYDLRYVSTLQLFMPDKVSSSEKDLKTLASSLRLKLHDSQRGDSLVSYYFDQIGPPLRRDAFNMGFFLAQIEVGRMILSASRGNPETMAFTKSGMAKAVVDLREKLQDFGSSDILRDFPSEPTEEQVKDLKSAIKNRLRTLDV